ncbi:MAG: DUF4238 domain-containing protein [Pseudomonadota bacterium]
MTQPKRHHWWPQFQSGHWTDENGQITAVRADGTSFRAAPDKLAVERDLYTRFDLSGEKDLSIESWFSAQIEHPFSAALKHIAALDEITVAWRNPPNPAKEQEIKELGFVVPKDAEFLPIEGWHRSAVNEYLAALLVRNPRYLEKLIAFHDEHQNSLPKELPRGQALKSVALDNMLSVFEIYRDKIAESHIALLIAEGSNDFLFGDAGITAQEPWKPGPIPFTVRRQRL